jgi:6-phosphogluconolactonase (cycloisomerase 2 family)
MRLWRGLLTIGVLLGTLGAGFAVAHVAAAVPTSHVSTALSTGSAGAVLILSNSPVGNRLLAYDRSSSGDLVRAGSFSTRGLGTGGGLGDQGALALTADHNWAIGVNAGSNSLSVFRVHAPGSSPLVSFASQASSRGILPVSLTVHGSWVFVVNGGTDTAAGNVAGFLLHSDGTLTPLAGSVRALPGGPGTAPAEIAFNPAGTVLVVTEKAVNRIVTYPVSSTGSVGAAKTFASSRPEPFGFAFSGAQTVLVSEATTSSLASLAVSASGAVSTVTPPLTNGEAAACWVATTGNGGFAYTSDTASNTISLYAVHTGGSLSLLKPVAASTLPAPIDLAFGGGHAFLYVHTEVGQAIQGFAVMANGALVPVGTNGGLPPAAEGLVAF